MPSGDQGPSDRPRKQAGEGPPKDPASEPSPFEQGLEIDGDDGASLGDDEPDPSRLDEELSGPASADDDLDLSDLDRGEGHDDDRVGAAGGDTIEGDFEEDDARDDDDHRGPDDDDEKSLDDLEDEGEDQDTTSRGLEAGGGDDDDLDTDDDSGDEDGGAEGIRDEDPNEGMDEPGALDGAEGEGEGLDEPLPELEEPS